MHVNQACLPRVENYFNLSSSDLGFIVLESAMWVVMKEMPYMIYICYIVFDFEHHMAVAGGRMWWKDLTVLRVSLVYAMT